MSITDTTNNCQELLTALRGSLPAYSAAILTEAALGGEVLQSLQPNQLALAAAWLSQSFPRQAIVLSLSIKKCQSFLELVAMWQSAIFPQATWHCLTGEITPQEQTGQITTQLTQALHCLLSAAPHHHFIIPEDLLSTDVPDITAYQHQHITLHVGETLSFKKLVADLVAAGYLRHTTTIEPGSIRVRGEQIDIYHPLFLGPHAVTFLGSTIESIVSYRGRRSATQAMLTIPPVKFPGQTMPLKDTLAAVTLYRPEHVTTNNQTTIVHDSLESSITFPWAIGKADQKPAAGSSTIILYENLDRIKNYSKDHPRPAAVLCRNPSGLKPIFLTTPHVTILSEGALLPEAATVRPVSYQRGLALLADLREGRPAVHSDHGIGIYEGLQTRRLGVVQRDYLILRYAAGDVLSVPVEFAHKVTPYLGEATPKLNRLGGTIWRKTRKQAKHDAEEFAKAIVRTAQERAGNYREAYYLDPSLEHQLEETFRYSLTVDQETTWAEVRNDLQQQEPMDRLIVGDVGFGKTEIAIRAACHVAANGKQVAILAPTTLLVQQHADTFIQRLPQQRHHIGVLSRFTSPAAARQLRQKIAKGEINIVIGTHALLSKWTVWQSLGLIIIDEEQRFGVAHKEHFKKLRATIDILSLSATPIPRTLSMALSGLKELSVISTPPEGRKSVATYVGRQTDELLAQAITRELQRRGQVYVVAPKIRGLMSLSRHLSHLVPQATIATIHGQLDSTTLASLMEQFDKGEINVLVSSTIIENGLDVPNANTLLVVHATHFGLSELYQLRGRIGRRERQGYAYFLYDQQELTSIQRARLTALTEATRLGSGWTLAQRDLEIRGAGNLLGAEQSGTVAAVGVQFYLDLIHDALEGSGGKQRTHRDVDIHLPLSAIIPATYIADVAQRTHYYQLLSRAATQAQLESHKKEMESYFGPFSDEVTNLYLLIQLQHAAAAVGISRISYQTITPPDEDPYIRLEIIGDPLPQILRRLQNLGNWVVRDNLLTLNMDAITPTLARKLLITLNTD